jgi:tetratricopeptide (TPR) repeat protein
MITGERAFQGTTHASLTAAILLTQPPPISSLRPETPPALNIVVKNCLLKNPEDRWQTSHDLLLQLVGITEEYSRGRERIADKNSLTPSTERKDTHAQKSRRARIALAATCLIVLLSGAWILRTLLPFQTNTVLAFQERDWVLISSFENRTGEAVFDGTLEYALESNLSNSQFVNVVPRERIEDALRLMKKPMATPIDLNVGREISIRDGAVRALLTGRIEKIGTTYIVTLKVVEPRQGIAVASTSEEAKLQEEVLPAIRRLSNWARKGLGEIRGRTGLSQDKLDHLTTSSLQALQLFTQADALMRNGQQAPAEPLLRSAIAEDGEFAFAQIFLAWCLRNQRKPSDQYMQYAEHALKSSSASTNRERYFIEGSYYSLRGDDQKAIPVYQALLRLYPDDYWANNNLVIIYERAGRIADAEQYVRRRAELRPNDAVWQWSALRELLWLGKMAEARQYISQVQKVADATAPNGIWAWSVTYPAYDQWFQGNVMQALNELDRVRQTVDKLNEPNTKMMLRLWLGETYLTLGRLVQAEELLPPSRPWRGVVAIARGDESRLRASLSEYPTPPNQPPPSAVLVLLCRAGLVSDVRRAITSAEAKLIPSADLKIIEGELMFADRRSAEAIPFLKDGLSGTFNNQLYFLGSDSLAKAMESQNDLQGAMRVLESASQMRSRARLDIDATLFWYQVQLRLAQLYRKAGREDAAQRIDKELSHLLEYADRDFYVLKQIKN